MQIVPEGLHIIASFIIDGWICRPGWFIVFLLLPAVGAVGGGNCIVAL